MSDVSILDSRPGAQIDGDGTGPTYRTAPHNLDAEQELLGAILVNNDAASRISDFLKPEHFAEPIHARIYEAAMVLIERGEIANPVTLKAHFANNDVLTELGGTQYLARLAAAATTIINAAEYGRIIHDLATRRELIRLGEEVVNRAYETGLDDTAPDQIEDAESALYRLAEEGSREGAFQPFVSALTEATRMIDAAYKRDGRLVGVSSGLKDLDTKLGGMHPSDLLVLAGRPAMGKTALATTIAYNAADMRQRTGDGGDELALSEGAVVGFFSLEMSAEQLATRLLAEACRISSERLRRGEVNDDEFTNQVMPEVYKLQTLPLFIDDTPALTISQLRTRARRLKRTHDLGLIVVDYLQLMRPSNSQRFDNRVQEISEITRGLKAVAKELNVPVLALSQLSRAVEQRDDKRPLLADLRESGSIEQDADVVMFIYREEYYLERKEPAPDTAEHDDWKSKMEPIHNVADVIIGKHRHGPTGTVKLMFERQFTAFRDLDRPDHLPEGY